MADCIVGLIVTIARKGTTKGASPKPYAVVEAVNGGNFCIFPKKGEAKAAKTVASLPEGKEITLSNVGFTSNGGVFVYDNTTVTVHK